MLHLKRSTILELSKCWASKIFFSGKFKSVDSFLTLSILLLLQQVCHRITSIRLHQQQVCFRICVVSKFDKFRLQWNSLGHFTLWWPPTARWSNVSWQPNVLPRHNSDHSTFTVCTFTSLRSLYQSHFIDAAHT